jgi:hypothetical protein
MIANIFKKPFCYYQEFNNFVLEHYSRRPDKYKNIAMRIVFLWPATFLKNVFTLDCSEVSDEATEYIGEMLIEGGGKQLVEIRKLTQLIHLHNTAQTSAYIIASNIMVENNEIHGKCCITTDCALTSVKGHEHSAYIIQQICQKAQIEDVESCNQFGAQIFKDESEVVQQACHLHGEQFDGCAGLIEDGFSSC